MINGVTRRRVIGADAAIGAITTASFALGLALFAIFGRHGRSFDVALFGSILGVSTDDVLAVAAVTVLVGVLVFFGYRQLLFTAFDPEVADASGVRMARVDALLMLVLAASILATMQVLGVTLIAATLVIPATVARMLTSSFSRMLILATAVGAFTGFAGMNLSYHLDVRRSCSSAPRSSRSSSSALDLTRERERGPDASPTEPMSARPRGSWQSGSSRATPRTSLPPRRTTGSSDGTLRECGECCSPPCSGAPPRSSPWDRSAGSRPRSQDGTSARWYSWRRRGP